MNDDKRKYLTQLGWPDELINAMLVPSESPVIRDSVSLPDETSFEDSTSVMLHLEGPQVIFR